MLQDVDANFCHRLDGEWMNVAGRLRASAGDVIIITQSTAQDAFGDVRATGVASAENQNGGFHGGRVCKQLFGEIAK
jgi:hypothetical protein